jgi:hypothetical protein
MNPEPTVPNEPPDPSCGAENKPIHLAEETSDASEKKESPAPKRANLFYEAAYFWTIMR